MDQLPQVRKKVVYTRIAPYLYLNEHSRIYSVVVKRWRKQIRRSLKTTHRVLAERRMGQFFHDLERYNLIECKVVLTFDDVAKRWLGVIRVRLKSSSFNRRQSSIKKLWQTFGALPVKGINIFHCEEWAKKRSEQVAASTYNQELGALISVFEYAVCIGLISNNPANGIPRRRGRKTNIIIPTRQQFDQIITTLRSLGVRYSLGADLYQLLAYSGMRKGDANAFRWSDVSFERGSFAVNGGETGPKNLEARVVPLFPILRAFLERLLSRAPTRKKGLVVSTSSARKAIITACKINCFPNFNHHSMRHFFVSNALDRGVDFMTIAAWVGHKDGGILVAKTYGHLRDAHSFEMAQRIN
jgi:integrase